MKNLILIYLFTLSCFAQKTIRVEYIAKINPLEKKFTQEKLNQMFQYAIDNDDKLSFELLISNNQARFRDISAMSTSESSHFDKLTLTFSGYLGEVYDSENFVYAQSTIIDPNILIKKTKITGWNLVDETKEIGGYLCYKATNVYIVVNPNKTFEHPVVAWYCPKLPYSYGPNGYGNLPGLILELQVRNVVFGATKIDLNSKQELSTTLLQKAKIITEQELNAIIEKDVSAMSPK